MINLQPLIEKFKKAVYGRDVRQSIVDLAQAIGDNHNEQEKLREEVKTLNADTKEENKQGKEYITNKKAEMDDAVTTGKASIESTVSTGKAAVDTAIIKAGESKTALESTIQQSERGKTSLDNTIQQSTIKDQELEAHIAEINQIIADGKAVTKRDLLNVERLIPPEILAIDAEGFIWYISQENINFYSIGEDIGEKTKRVEAYCNIKLSEVKEKITRDGNMASLNISGWDRMLANNIPFITSNTQVFVNITGLKIITPLPFCSELTDNGVKVDWTSQSGETTEKDASIFVKLVSFY